MTKLQTIIIILFSTVISDRASSQSECSLTLQDKIEGICERDESWSCVHSSDKTTLTYKGNFTTNFIRGARDISKKDLKRPDTNSVSFDFRISDGWSDSVYSSVKKRNSVLLEDLKANYIAHYDSIGWPEKQSQSVFKASPMYHLKHVNFKSEELYSNIIRLPDFRINECGVWIDSSIHSTFEYIVQYEVRDAVFSVIQEIVSLDPYVNNSLDGLENF